MRLLKKFTLLGILLAALLSALIFSSKPANEPSRLQLSLLERHLSQNAVIPTSISDQTSLPKTRSSSHHSTTRLPVASTDDLQITTVQREVARLAPYQRYRVSETTVRVDNMSFGWLPDLVAVALTPGSPRPNAVARLGRYEIIERTARESTGGQPVVLDSDRGRLAVVTGVLRLTLNHPSDLGPLLKDYPFSLVSEFSHLGLAYVETKQDDLNVLLTTLEALRKDSRIASASLDILSNVVGAN